MTRITGTPTLMSAGMQQYEGMKLPDGRDLVTVTKNRTVPLAISPGELARVLIAAGVPGVSHLNGKEDNLRAYKAHLDSIGEKAATEAADRWRAKVNDSAA